MRFFRHATPLPAPTAADAQTDAGGSSDALSELLDQLNDTSLQAQLDAIALPRQEDTIWLDSNSLLQQGKVHKNHILTNWIACQSYLTHAELEAKARRPRRSSLPHGDDCTLSDTTSRSGMTSRTSTSLTLARPTSFAVPKHSTLIPTVDSSDTRPRSRFSLFRKSSKSQPSRSELCTGVRYESLGPPFLQSAHDDVLQTEEEWMRLNEAWRLSLHLAGPKTQSKRSFRTRPA